MRQVQTEYMNLYISDPVAHWDKKIVVLNLIAGCAISHYTFKSGATQVLIPVEQLQEYMSSLVMSELA